MACAAAHRDMAAGPATSHTKQTTRVFCLERQNEGQKKIQKVKFDTVPTLTQRRLSSVLLEAFHSTLLSSS